MSELADTIPVYFTYLISTFNAPETLKINF